MDQLTDIKQLEGAIEAILFAAGHPMEYTVIAETLGLSERDAKNMIEHVGEKYNKNETGGIILLMYPETCQLCTRETYKDQIRTALGIRRGGNLSASSLEVLSIVAYNQPVTRSFVDTVRGVDSAYAFGSLVDKELIAAEGRLDAPGRPMLYGTTDKFLRVFGLSSLEGLPEAAAVLSAVDALAKQSEDTGDGGEEDDGE